MRILLVVTSRFIAGGAEHHVRTVLPGLVARGHEIALMYEKPAAAGRPTIDDTVPGIPSWHARDSDPADALLAAEDWRPDLAYVHGVAQPALEAKIVRRFVAVLCAHNYYGTCATGRKWHAF